MKLTFVTGNKEKLKEVSEILGKDFEIENQDIDLEEIQELDGEKVAIRKANDAFEILQKPLIVEDTSLYINSWNGLPGTLNKWFIKTVGNEGIVKMLSRFENKSANAETIVVYKDSTTTKAFRGMVEGTISNTVKGRNGFGWDKIFIPNGYGVTQAEMTAEEKNRQSTRKIAIEKLKEYLLNR